MARYRGNDGVVKIGPTPTVVTGEVVEFTLEEEQDTIREPGLADEWDPADAGGKRWSASVTFWLDPDAGAAFDLVPLGGKVAVELYPNGDAAGRTYAAGLGLVKSRSLPVARNTTNRITVQLGGDGALTWDTV